ncbi:cyclic-phosphate processing receiver domain-containing protein [Alicyclobacillus fastidiosus]|uniref:Cyclic-phosphate processing Receiver domain-containing protein n=1 Tax=Alicyclobacillus fastidiosus TaxID=392011 RepID=A0ABV5AE64_9BACL|nr:cyclic-phosphate processing receiver domain-containing protein [Alicyclobacillus fastidiosus]WEH09898.1 hypothetical protein PYS47_00955 [Alicyclobacillus fastidiosus]
MGINVFLDDRRQAPDGFTLVKRYERCVRLLATGQVDKLSLDYNLGKGEKTGLDVAKWIVQQHTWPREIYIHSSNFLVRQAMSKLLRQHAPEHVVIRSRTFPVGVQALVISILAGGIGCALGLHAYAFQAAPTYWPNVWGVGLLTAVVGLAPWSCWVAARRNQSGKRG